MLCPQASVLQNTHSAARELAQSSKANSAIRAWHEWHPLGMGEERSSIACLRNPLPLLHPRRYRHQRTTHGQSDWVNLLWWTLSFPTPIRFIPALSCVPSRLPFAFDMTNRFRRL